MTLRHPFLYKAELIRRVRELLHQEGFIELATPIIRRHDGHQFCRRFHLKDGRYLRESPAHALRCNLEIADKIFEIAPCFRSDSPDSTHLCEFLMLDLYARNCCLSGVMQLAQDILRLFYDEPIEHLSFAEFVRDQHGIDFFDNPNADVDFSTYLQKNYGYDHPSYLKRFDQFVVDHIEPRSKGHCLVVVDFPLAAEPRAKRREGTVGVAERFEFQINGIEIFHGYTDETDLDAVTERAKRWDLFGTEEQIMNNLLSSGRVPSQSAGFGFGIERLCQVCTDEKEISNFTTSMEFV
jgi:lysyl-tRNA synthetase, class II